MAKANGFVTVAKGKSQSVDERMAAWSRRKGTTGVDFKEVSGVSLKSALHVVIAEGAALTISAAMGGRGVCLKLWLDGQPKTEYAATAEEVNELLDGLVEALGSASEDIRTAMSGGEL